MITFRKDRRILHELIAAVRAYDDNLDANERAPDGDDYNALLDMVEAAANEAGEK